MELSVKLFKKKLNTHDIINIIFLRSTYPIITSVLLEKQREFRQKDYLLKHPHQKLATLPTWFVSIHLKSAADCQCFSLVLKAIIASNAST